MHASTPSLVHPVADAAADWLTDWDQFSWYIINFIMIVVTENEFVSLFKFQRKVWETVSPSTLWIYLFLTKRPRNWQGKTTNSSRDSYHNNCALWARIFLLLFPVSFVPNKVTAIFLKRMFDFSDWFFSGFTEFVPVLMLHIIRRRFHLYIAGAKQQCRVLILRSNLDSLLCDDDDSSRAFIYGGICQRIKIESWF